MHHPLPGIGRGLGAVRRRRHHLDDPVSASLQLPQQVGQGLHGFDLDVMEQQNPFVVGLDALQGARIHLRRADSCPIVGQEVGAPDLEIPGREIALDAVGAQQTGNAEERRRAGAVAER